MNKETITELLNKELDGVLTAAERQALEEVLAADEDARNLRRDLRAVAGLCAQANNRVDPPPSLRPAVRRAIEERRHRMAQPAPAMSGTLRLPHLLSRFFPERHQPRLAYAFWGGIALGGIAGLVLTLMLGRMQPGTVAEDEVLGSIFSGSRTESAWNTLTVSAPQIEGTIASRESGPLQAVEIDLANRGSETLRLRLGIGTREVKMLSHLDADQPGGEAASAGEIPVTVEIREGRIVVDGRQITDFRLLLERTGPSPGPVSVELFSGDRSLYTASLFPESGTDAVR